MKKAIEKSGMDEQQIRDLYLDSVRLDTTPRHIMSVEDSLKILEYSLAGNDKMAKELVKRLRLASTVK